MNNNKMRIIALILTVLLFVSIIAFGKCCNKIDTDKLQVTDVALTDDGTRVVVFVDTDTGDEYVQYGDSEIALIGDD